MSEYQIPIEFAWISLGGILLSFCVAFWMGYVVGKEHMAFYSGRKTRRT